VLQSRINGANCGSERQPGRQRRDRVLFRVAAPALRGVYRRRLIRRCKPSRIPSPVLRPGGHSGGQRVNVESCVWQAISELAGARGEDRCGHESHTGAETFTERRRRRRRRLDSVRPNADDAGSQAVEAGVRYPHRGHWKILGITKPAVTCRRPWLSRYVIDQNSSSTRKAETSGSG
jgi:hypothetical protein